MFNIYFWVICLWHCHRVCVLFHDMLSTKVYNPCQYLIPHNIWSLGPLFLLRKENFDSACRSALRKSNIKLTMRKHWSSKIKTNILDRLTLWLVDGHCKSQTNRELTTWKRDVQVSIRWLYWNPWDEDDLSISTQDPAFQDMWFDPEQDHVCAIAKAIRRTWGEWAICKGTTHFQLRLRTYNSDRGCATPTPLA